MSDWHRDKNEAEKVWENWAREREKEKELNKRDGEWDQLSIDEGVEKVGGECLLFDLLLPWLVSSEAFEPELMS